MRCLKQSISLAVFIVMSAMSFADEALNFNGVNIAQYKAETAEDRRPLLLYVSHTTCGFCKRLDRDVMPAVVNTEQYQQAVVLQKLVWDSATPVNWFDNETLSPDEIVIRYKVRATPTLLFLDTSGNEIAKRIEGYQGPDFYWEYMDRSIEQARKVMAEGV